MKDIRRVIQRLVRRVFAKGVSVSTPLDPVSAVTVRLPPDFKGAVARLTDWNSVKDARHQRRRASVDVAGAHPLIVDFYVAFQRELERRGMAFYAHEFYRSDERQNELYAKGVTKARGAEGPHNYGCAVDVVHSMRFWDLTPKEWDVIGAIGKEVARKRHVKLTWGGDFRSIYDPAHWELTHWREVKDYHLEHMMDFDEVMEWADFLMIENAIKPSGRDGKLGTRAKLIADNRKIKKLLER
jgi:hypothetical protein